MAGVFLSYDRDDSDRADQTAWPQAIGLSIETINSAPFLTRQQKRDILYNNVARFLRLTPEQIAADHRR